MEPVSVSVVLPAFDEADNLVELVPAIVDQLGGLGRTWEVLVVDDGSTDGTRDAIVALGIEGVRCVRLRRNSGKSAALSVGLDEATGEVVVLMDADGQDDPAELPRLLAAIDDGADLVTGRRAVRHDRFVKRHTSRLFNAVTRWFTGVRGSDFNSGYKAMTAEVAASLELYGELHRYIPVLASWQGFGVTEVDVAHHPRRHGRTKFGPVRFWRGFLDLITVKFLTQYVARPFHLFGGLGILLTLATAREWRFFSLARLIGRPLVREPAQATETA